MTQAEYHSKPVQDTDELEVVTNQYRAIGGGNYSMFKPEKIVREVPIDMTELIAEYLRKSVIEATVSNNFKTVVTKKYEKATLYFRINPLANIAAGLSQGLNPIEPQTDGRNEFPTIRNSLDY